MEEQKAFVEGAGDLGGTMRLGSQRASLVEGSVVAGAYGATMANTYNSRALVPEVLVEGDQWAVVRNRLPLETLIAADQLPPWLEKQGR